jgi:hypothetical protein
MTSYYRQKGKTTMPSSNSYRFFGKPATAIGASFLALFLTAGAAHSAKAPKRCDWHGPTSGGEKPYAKCFDFAAIQGKTITLPKNVTRIASDGLSFCQPPTPVTGAGDADIVFIYDNSGSMTADAAYVNPVTKDTNFYFITTDNNCKNNIIEPKQLITYPDKNTGTWSVFAMSGESNCSGNIPGDPYNARGSVIKAGIDFLAATSPTSTAGAISFNDKINYEQEPLLMSSAGNIAQVKSSIKLDTAGSTQYRPPLVQVKSWLNNPAVIKTKKQAIIFISDGASNSYNYMDLVDANMPPIHSIYLSDTETDGVLKLKELSDATGGSFNRVNTSDPKAMEAILKTIISTITKNTLPKSATITNKSLAPPQTSKSTGVVANPDGSAGMKLDSIIALKLGNNSIEINLVREDNTTTNYSFTMNVAGDEIGSSSGTYTCWDMPTLVAIDPKTNLPAEIYRPDANTLNLKLTRSPSELSNVSVDGTTANKDEETIGLTGINNSLGFPTQTGPFTYNPAKSSPGLNNNVMEVDGKGDMTFTWTHPRDERESVTYILPGRVVPILNGDVTLKIKDPVTTGTTFDPGTLIGKDPVVVTDGKDKCIVNCSGTEVFHTSNGLPTWTLTVKSPIKYSIRLFDNLGQFVSTSEGEMDAAAWAAISKTGDSAVVNLKIMPISSEGQQLGTGAYLMMATITALGDQVTKGSTGESIIVKNAKRDYLKRFGYVRN